jgi:hypothetical protein
MSESHRPFPLGTRNSKRVLPPPKGKIEEPPVKDAGIGPFEQDHPERNQRPPPLLRVAQDTRVRNNEFIVLFYFIFVISNLKQ